MVIYLVALACACLPAAAVVVFFSQLSFMSPTVVNFLSSNPLRINGVSMMSMLVVITTVGVSTILACGRGKGGVVNRTWRWWLPWWVFLALSLFMTVLLVPRHPCFAVALLAGSGALILFALRRTCFQEVEQQVWFQATSLAFAIAAVGCLVVWFTWIAIGFPGRNHWTDWSAPFAALVRQRRITWKMAFVAWSAPLAVAVELGLAALLCWMRRRHNQLHDALDANNDQTTSHTWIISAMKQLSVFIAVFVLLAWLYAALSATWETRFDQDREDLRDEVLGLGFLVFMCVFFWTVDTIGPVEIKAAAKGSKVVQETLSMMEGDWSKAALLLVAALPMCAAYLLDTMEQRLGAQKERPLLWFVRNWSWTSIIVKAVWLGIGYIGIVVGFAKFTNVLLALINESLMGWHVYTVSAAMFAIGFSLFLLPPAPGAPIYVFMGIVIVSSAMKTGWMLGEALAWATFIAFAMKMAFTFAAQRFIGQPLSENESVRQLCELHTPYMRAMENILKKPGLSLAKVTLLVGGPDWPVAVLCGILQLPISQVQLGTSPVLLQSVFPCVLAGTLMLTDDDRNSFGMAEVALAIAGFLQAGSAAIAFFYVQETLECQYEELSQPREEDRRIVELEALQNERSRRFWKELSWEFLPCWSRFLLLTSLFCMEVSCILLTGPWEKILGRSCFRTFGLQSSVARDLGGNPLAIVLPLGWVALAFSAASSILIAVFYMDAQRRSTCKGEEESSHLLADCS